MPTFKHFLWIGISLFSASVSQAWDIVVTHSDDTDPTTEGWSFLAGAGASPTVGAVSDTGFDAWLVDDNASALGDFGWYQFAPTTSQINQGNSLGWTLRARLRVVDIPDTPGGSPGVSYRDGATGWQMHFGTEADGDPIVELLGGGGSFTIQGTGGGYHLYELVYDPNAGSADLFVNGSEVLSNYTGFVNSDELVLWGGFSSFDVGQANYNLVQFVTVPEPVNIRIARPCRYRRRVLPSPTEEGLNS